MFYTFFQSNYILTLLGFFVVIVISFLIYFIFFSRMNRMGTSNQFNELHLKIREDIKYAVAPKFMEISVGVTELIELATEVWRIEQRLAKVVDTLPENHKKGLENSLHKLKRYISKYDIEIVDYTNQKFNDGLNLDVLSIEKDPNVKAPIVKETIEPTILCKGQVVKKAKIILINN